MRYNLGRSFSPSNSLLESCHVMLVLDSITVECTYSESVTGFQMIAYLSASREVNKLYVNQTTNRQTSISVTVEENGMYQVAIFPIKRDGGIAGSAVEYTQRIMIPAGMLNDSVRSRIIICFYLNFSRNHTSIDRRLVKLF